MLAVLVAISATFAAFGDSHGNIGGALLENEEKVYGPLHDRIAERIRLWPGLAPHETEANLGRYAFDERSKVWRRYDVSCPEVVILKPEKPTCDTLVVGMPGSGYVSQNMGYICRVSLPSRAS